MNSALRFGLAAMAVVVVAFAGLSLLPRSGGVGGPGSSPTAVPTASEAPSQTAAPSPTASQALPGFPIGLLNAGTYTIMPFTSGGGVCLEQPQAGCVELDQGDTLRFTVTVPAGWNGIAPEWIVTGTEAGTADVILNRGAWLLSDPCKAATPDIPVGPTVADFVDAIAAHPILDTTAPVDVMIGGYSGKYLEIQGPSEVDPKCPEYRPWDPGIYMQGPGNRWRLWVLDVDGARVVIQGMDYPGTPEARRTELQAIVESIQIEP